MCRCGLNPLKDVSGRESISLCHGKLGLVYVPMTASAILIVLLMTGAGSNRNM
jgi:hypothetical protein